jgi:uncharacterized integral membrane protein
LTSEPGDQTEPQQSRRITIWLIVAGLIVVAVAIFIGQNGDDVSISFLWFSGEMPLWLLIVLMLIAGAILGQVGLYLRRRRKRRDEGA